MAKMMDLPADPNLTDVARAILQTHACLEEHKKATAIGFDAIGAKIDKVRAAQSGVKRALGEEKSKTTARLKALEAGQQIIKDAVGADQEHPTVAGMTQRKLVTGGVIIAALAAVPGAIALVKFLAPLIASMLAYAIR